MKKLLKNALALTLTIVLIASTMATGFSVLAEDSIPSYYGTEADGFDSTYSCYPQPLKPVDSIKNLDFANGFIYWSGRNKNNSGVGTKASSSFKLVDTGTNKYVTLKDEGYVDNMRTALFNVSNNVSVGDKIVAIYFGNGADVTKLRVMVFQDYIRNVTYDETTGRNNTSTSASPGGETQVVGSAYAPSQFKYQAEATNWTAYVTPSNVPVADPTTKSSTIVPTANIYLQVMITRDSSSVSVGDKFDVAIDNIILAKVVDGVYYNIATGEEITQETIDNAAPPSLEDNQGGEEPPVDEPTVEANPPKNLDFSDGFNYWQGETSIYSAVDGVLKPNDTYTEGSWRWLKTEKFNIPNAVVGTTVRVSFNVEFEDDLVSMKSNTNYQNYLNSEYGYKLLHAYLYKYGADGTQKSSENREIFYGDEGPVAVNSIKITDPQEEFEFWISCGNSSKKSWEITNIVITATHPDGTVDTYPASAAKHGVNADSLVWLMNLILTDDLDYSSADFNADKAVNILDVVNLKKKLVAKVANQVPIEGPTYEATTEDVYSSNIVRYELNSQCKGYYFTPKEPGEYQTIILMHGQGNVTRFKERLLSHFNEWVKAGYIEPMVVVLPEVMMSYAGSSSESDIEDFHGFVDPYKSNRFRALLTSIRTGTLSSKIDTSKKPFVAGFSMGGMAALSVGVTYRAQVSQVGALSPATAFYLGEGQWGYCNYASDIEFSSDPDAHVYLSAGLAETNFTGGHTFTESINRYEQGSIVNNADIVTKFIAPESWGNHAYPLAHKEIFMFLHLASYGRLPSVELVEKVCTNSEVYTVPTVVYSAAEEHQ